MQTTREPQPFLVQLLDLTLVQLSNWRWSWHNTIIVSIVAPLISMLGLGVFARGSGPQTLTYILIGNVVLALMFENEGKVSSNFAFMRAMGTLDYFASLPIHRYSLILATILSFFILSLPALIVTLLFGSLFLHVPLSIHPLAILVIPLAIIPLASLGALIGVSSRSVEEVGPISNFITFLMLGLGPVLIPPDRLPGILRISGWISPASYTASALRQALIGPVTWRIGLDLTALALFTILLLWLVIRKMDWRQT